MKKNDTDRYKIYKAFILKVEREGLKPDCYYAYEIIWDNNAIIEINEGLTDERGNFKNKYIENLKEKFYKNKMKGIIYGPLYGSPLFNKKEDHLNVDLIAWLLDQNILKEVEPLDFERKDFDGNLINFIGSSEISEDELNETFNNKFKEKANEYGLTKPNIESQEVLEIAWYRPGTFIKITENDGYQEIEEVYLGKNIFKL